MNKFMKKYLLIASSVVLMLIFSGVNDVRSADQTITCSNSDCFGLAGQVFAETGILPGDGVTRSIEVKNNTDESLLVRFEITKNTATDDDFVDIVELTIGHDSTIIYSDVFANAFADDFELGEIGPGNNSEVKLNLLLPVSAGNEYQNKSADFDITFYIEGSESGETQVVSTNSQNNSDTAGTADTVGQVLGTSDESLLDKVLGLSDTNSGKKFLASVFVGVIMLLVGLNMIISTLDIQSNDNKRPLR